MPNPAVPGNVGALVHGAATGRAVEPVAAGIREQLLAAAPYLADPRYAGAVAALAVTEARLALLDRFLADKGLVNRKGRPWAAADYAFRMERLADNLRQSLGLTPASRARLGRHVASTEVDLARLWSQQGDAQSEPGGAVPTHWPDAPEQGDTVPAGEAAPADGPAGGDL